VFNTGLASFISKKRDTMGNVVMATPATSRQRSGWPVSPTTTSSKYHADGIGQKKGGISDPGWILEAAVDATGNRPALQ
jgi:hypothetical protein